MKRNIKKPLCITLCTLLLAGSIGIAAHAAVPNEKNFGTAAASNGTAGLNSLNSDMLPVRLNRQPSFGRIRTEQQDRNRLRFCFRLR